MKFTTPAILLATILAGHAPAQTSPAGTPTTAPTPSRAPAQPPATNDLSGPKVAQPSAGLTLVKKNFNGGLDRITQPVEEAAVAILPLSDDERAKVNTIIVQRAAVVDKGIRESVPLLLRIQGIREEGITTDRQSAIRDLDKKIPILRDRDPFRAELRLAMGAENAAKFDALINDYTRAAIADAIAKAKADGKKGNAFLMSLGESLRNVGMEIQQSYDRIIKEGTDKLDRAIEIIQPTPEQEGAVRNLANDFAQKSLANPTAAQRAEFFKTLMAMLTIPQRERLVRELYGPITAEAVPAGEDKKDAPKTGGPITPAPPGK